MLREEGAPLRLIAELLGVTQARACQLTRWNYAPRDSI
jgi:hypothetical protein